MPENSYKFYQNLSCKYFPCHSIKDESDFNCLFCYCPLYFLEDCGGNFTYFKNIKDCSKCLFPHYEKSYDLINKRIQKENEKKITP